MAVNIENNKADKIILGFSPKQLVVEGQQLKLGEVDGYNLDYENRNLQERLTDYPDEPLLFSWRTRPVVVLKKRDGNGQLIEARPLAYATDVKALDEGLAQKVADHLAVIQSRLGQENPGTAA